MKKVSLLFLIMVLNIAFVQPSFLHTMLERITNPKGRTPLMEAILYNASDDVFNQALAKAQTTNTEANLDFSGKSALDYAVEGKRLDFATQLSRVLRLRKHYGRTYGVGQIVLSQNDLDTLENAAQSMEALIAKLTEQNSEPRRIFFKLLAKDCVQDALFKAAIKASPNMPALLLLRYYGKPLKKSQFCDSFTTLNQLEDKDIEPKIALFIKLGVDINLETILQILDSHKNINPAYIQALLKNGLNFTKKDKNGQTCLHYAISNGQDEIFSILLAHIQANNRQDLLDAQSTSGNTALHLAAENDPPWDYPEWAVKKINKTHFITALLAAGASTTLQNNSGKTPIECNSSLKIRDLFVTKQLLP